MKGFVKSVVSLSLVLGLACAAEAKTVLNLDFLSNEGTAEHASTLFLKQYVENRTGGELQIDIYAGAQLCGNPIECFQSLESGVVHIYPATAGGIAVVYPPIAALDIPYIMPSETVAQNVLSGPFEDKLRELIYKNTNGKLLMMSLSNSAGWRNYANAKHPVKSPADLKGLKLRTVENKVQQEQVRLNGASPTPIPFMEVYDALSKGVVDGTLNSITDLTAVRLHEKAKYMTLDGHNFMFSAWFMNANYFKSLPKEFQDALIDGFKLMGIVENGVQMDMERPAYAAFAKAGGQTYFPTAEEKAQFIEVVKPLRDMYLQETEGGAEFLKELDAAIANASKFEQNRRASFDALK